MPGRRVSVTMRLGLALAVGCLLAGCGGSTPQIQGAKSCTTGYSAAHGVIQVAVADNGRSLAVPLCDSISAVLAGSPSSQWQTIQSSDERVLEVVPLPLPAPPPGGTRAVYLAKATGTGTLVSAGPDLRCANPVGICPIVRWMVKITVIAGP